MRASAHREVSRVRTYVQRVGFLLGVLLFAMDVSQDDCDRSRYRAWLGGRTGAAESRVVRTGVPA